LKPSRSFHRQADGKSLQRFLGLLNCYRRILSGLAGLLQPLTDILRATKQTITSAVLLGHPSDMAVRSLVVDASESYVGPVCATAALLQLEPLAFFSAKTSSTQARYSTLDCELLAAFSAIQYFR
jgi:hypothetical protein